MGIFNFRLPIFLIGFLFLSACVQSISDSSVYIDEAYLSVAFREYLIEKVYEKGAELGMGCKLRDELRELHVCQISGENPSLDLSVGYNRNGSYSISVISTFVHFFPPSRKSVVSGNFIDAEHIDLERWMRGLVPAGAIIKAERNYSGYDVSQSF